MPCSNKNNEDLPLLQQMLTKHNVKYQEDDGFVVVGDDGNEIEVRDEYHDCYQDDLLSENGSVLLYKILKKSTNEGTTGKATNRLINEIRELFDSEAFKSGLFSFKLGEDNDLYEWWVKVYKVDKKTTENSDLRTLRRRNKVDHMLFRFCFGVQYPYEPPTVRLVSQELYDDRSRGVKRVCDRLLSKKMWSPACSMTSVITEIAKCPKQKLERPAGEVIIARLFEYVTNGGRQATQAFIFCVWMVLITSVISMMVTFHIWYFPSH